MPPAITHWLRLRPPHLVVDGGVLLTQSTWEGPAAYLAACYQALGLQYPRFFRTDDLSRMGLLAAHALPPETAATLPPESVAVVLANASASLHTDASFAQGIAQPTDYAPSPSLFVYTLPSVMAGEMCIYRRWQGENLFLVQPTFDPAAIAAHLQDLFEQTDTQACLAGWVERAPGDAATALDAVFWWAERNPNGSCLAIIEQVLSDIYWLKR